jgi:hypothetical protein
VEAEGLAGARAMQGAGEQGPARCWAPPLDGEGADAAGRRYRGDRETVLIAGMSRRWGSRAGADCGDRELAGDRGDPELAGDRGYHDRELRSRVVDRGVDCGDYIWFNLKCKGVFCKIIR